MDFANPKGHLLYDYRVNDMINAIDQKLKNVQCFTGNQLKLIACLCMLIDHISKIPMSKYMDKLFSLSLEGMISEEQFFALQDFQ